MNPSLKIEIFSMSTPQPSDWHVNVAVCPPFAEIADALQDARVAATSNAKLSRQMGIQKRKCVKMAKIATLVCKRIKELHNPAAQLHDNV